MQFAGFTDSELRTLDLALKNRTDLLADKRKGMAARMAAVGLARRQEILSEIQVNSQEAQAADDLRAKVQKILTGGGT